VFPIICSVHLFRSVVRSGGAAGIGEEVAMYALSEAPVVSSTPTARRRPASGRPMAPVARPDRTRQRVGTSPGRRLDQAVYRRRRLAVVVLATLAVVVVAGVVGGVADRALVERAVGLVAFVGWAGAAVALTRWDRRRPAC